MQVEKKSIAVLGAGAWGTALSMVLARNGANVFLWDRDKSLLQEIIQAKSNPRYLPSILLPKEIEVREVLQEAVELADIVLIVVPSHGFTEIVQTIQPFLHSEQSIIWATKGLEPKQGHFFHEVVERILGEKQRYAVLSGPSFAKEVALGLPTAVTLGARDVELGKDLCARFCHTDFSVDLTDDIIGVQLGGVVKNVVGVAVGVSDGVQFGANARSALITRGLTEMMDLGKALGARAETVLGLAGCGDLVLTCTDNQSRNRRFGLLLAEGLTTEQALQKIGQVVEAVYNVKQLYELGKEKGVRLPITEQVFRIMNAHISPKEAIKALFKKEF